MLRDLLVPLLNAKRLNRLKLIPLIAGREIVFFRYRRGLFIALQVSLT
jgi:hypothetical protein